MLKRRTFIASLVGLGVAVALHTAYVATNKTEVDAKKKAKALFRRFFTTANGFPPNKYQTSWFHNYLEGEHHFRGDRQTGMTTFMLTLALYETKCNGINVVYFPQYHSMELAWKVNLDMMQYRIGRSVKDGKLFCGRYYDRFDQEIRGHRAKGFFANDGRFLSMNSPKHKVSLDVPKKDHYYFGTC